jgi:hypothetical protein
MEMKGFRNDTGQIAYTSFVPEGYEPGCNMQETLKDSGFWSLLFDYDPVSSSDREDIRFFPLPTRQFTYNLSSY